MKRLFYFLLLSFVPTCANAQVMIVPIVHDGTQSVKRIPISEDLISGGIDFSGLASINDPRIIAGGTALQPGASLVDTVLPGPTVTSWGDWVPMYSYTASGNAAFKGRMQANHNPTSSAYVLLLAHGTNGAQITTPESPTDRHIANVGYLNDALANYQPLNANLTGFSGINLNGYPPVPILPMKVPGWSNVEGFRPVEIFPHASHDLGVLPGMAARGNDNRFPTTAQKAALAGVGGAPSTNNRYLTEAILSSHFEPPYVVVFIPIPQGSGWTDFELKASSDNFDQEMEFFYHSPDPTKSIIGTWANRPDVYFTDSGRTGHPNRRMWIKQLNQSIYHQLTDAHSEVGGIIIVIRDNLRSLKDSLVFSYCLGDGVDWEQDGAGRTIWRPAYPVDWVYDFTP